jgi:hypothetical protein
VLVLAVLLLPTKSVTRFAAIEGTNVPYPLTVAVRVKVLWSPESAILHVIPVAVPDWVISDVVNIAGMIGSEKTTVNRIGRVLTGSAWPVA